MHTTLRTAALAIVFTLAPACLLAQVGADSAPNGWYRTEKGVRILVSPAPDSGYRYLDFKNADFGPLPLVSGDRASEGGFHTTVGKDGRVEALVSKEGRRWSRMEDAPYELREVSFRSADSVELSGLILKPRRFESGAVLVHGSGDSDRDNVWAYSFAHSLADAGICVLFPDKRGSGESGGDWREVALDGLARDAVAGARKLAEHCNLPSDRIGWLGLSQGGWVAALAHRFSGDGAFQISVSAAAVPVFEQMEHEATNTLEAAGLGGDRRNQALRLLKAVRRFATGAVPWRNYAALRDSVSEGPLGSFAAAMPSDPNHWRWTWWNRVGRFDPVKSWVQSNVPLFIIYGEKDQEDNVPVEQSVRRLHQLRLSQGSPPLDVKVLADRGHTLVDPESGWIDDAALEQIVGWILARSNTDATPGSAGREEGLRLPGRVSEDGGLGRYRGRHAYQEWPTDLGSVYRNGSHR